MKIFMGRSGCSSEPSATVIELRGGQVFEQVSRKLVVVEHSMKSAVGGGCWVCSFDFFPVNSTETGPAPDIFFWFFFTREER